MLFTGQAYNLFGIRPAQIRMSSLLERLQFNGYAEIADTDSSISTSEIARKLAIPIGAIVSEVVEQLDASPTGSKPLNTYGGNYGLGRLPLHTDLAHWHRPPRYVLLRCQTGTPSVATHLLHRRQLEEWIPKSMMQRALFSPRRRLDGKMFLLRMLSGDLIRWDQLFLKPQNAAAHEVASRMQEIELELPIVKVLLSSAGQALLIDNWLVLHGRSSVPATESNRKLDRVYLETSTHGNKDSS